MSPITFTLMMLFFCVSTTASSQTKLKAGTLRHQNVEYRIGQVEDTGNFIFSVRNRPNIPTNPEMVNNNRMPWHGVVSRLKNPQELVSVVSSAISKDRLTDVKNGAQKLDITMFCGRDGNIIYLYFTVPENTMLTEQELTKMYVAIESSFVPVITSRYNLHRELN